MANHRIIEDVFFRIPLSESGGIGMFGRAKLSAFTGPQPCISSSADCRFCSWMSLNASAEHLRNQNTHYRITWTKNNLYILPLSSFPPRPTNSSKSFTRFHALGGWKKYIILTTDMALKINAFRNELNDQDRASTFWGSIFSKTISSATACMYLIKFQLKACQWKIK